MDIYAIICIFVLIIQAIWHAIIGSLIFLNTPDNIVKPSMWFVTLDQIVLFSLVGLFVLMHIGLLSWMYMVPFKHRSNMSKKDEEYDALANKKYDQKNKSLGKNVWSSSSYLRMPIEK
jgi:hypothetical protein